MAYNTPKFQQFNQTGEHEVWNRSIEILKLLTEADRQYILGENIMSPAFDQEYGVKRNLVGVITMQKSCKTVFGILFPYFKDTVKDEEGSAITIKGVQTSKFRLCKQKLGQITDLINKANMYPLGKPQSNQYLQSAYVLLEELREFLRMEETEGNFDFGREADPRMAYKDMG